MKLQTLIVDDEPLARAGLRQLLEADEDIGPVRESRNGNEAVDSIYAARPDLVFLDVQMPELDGIGVVREVGARYMPPVVFVTAHDRYALDAFELNAIDYLLKPVTRDRFALALARAKERLRERSAGDQLSGLLETLAGRERGVRRLAVRTQGRTEFVNVDVVDYFEAAENYVELHVGKQSHLLQVTMNGLERSLDATRFVRIHRSFIVPVARIQSLEPSTHGEYVITLMSGMRLRSGRSYGDRVRALAANPF